MPSSQPTYAERLLSAEKTLVAAYEAGRIGYDNFALIARHLLAHTIGKNTAFLHTFFNDPLPEDFPEADFQNLILRACENEPLAYLIGYYDFYSLRLEVAPCTLIPRPETEEMVSFLVKLLSENWQSKDLISKNQISRNKNSESSHSNNQQRSILDLGCGTGAIALSLAKAFPLAEVLAADILMDCLHLTEKNAVKNAILNIKTRQSSWFDRIEQSEKFDLIVSNPPYIAADDAHLKRLTFEPVSALVAEDNGLADLRAIIQRAPFHLKRGGFLVLEHGFDQQRTIMEWLKIRGFNEIKPHIDFAQQPRFIIAKWV